MGNANPEDRSARPSAFAKLFYFMRPDRGRMILSLAMACIGETLGMVPYIVIAVLAAGILENALSIESAAWLYVGAALCQVAKFLFTWRSSMMSHGIAFKALRSMREKMAEKMARVPMGTIVDTPTGTFKNRFVDNVNQLEDAIAHFMPELPSNVFAPALAMAIVFAVDWRMGLAGIATIPLGVLFYLGMMRGYREKMARYLGSEQKMNSTLVEYVNGIQVIKAFGRSASSYGTFSEAVAEYHDSTLAWFRQSWVWMALVRSVVPCTLLFSLPLGVWLLSAGELGLPEFMVCITIPLCFIGGVLKFAQAAGQISRMDACLNVIWDFLGLPELSRPTERVELSGEPFAFEDVSFSYHEGTEVLHGVTFRTDPGTMTAIVGPSGSGKSTAAKLMAGFWDASAGEIKYGGRDVRDIPFEQLMEHVSYVAQDTFLFDATIADNIRLGRPEATDAKVERAARGRRPRLRRASAQGLRHAGRRGRRTALRRGAPAHHHRAGDPEGRGRCDPRRGDGVRRPRERGGGAARHRKARGGKDARDDRPPPVDGRGGGPDSRDGRRARGGMRQTRGPPRILPPVRAHVGGAHGLLT